MLDNFRTALSYQLLYIKIMTLLPTDDELEIFDNTIDNIERTIKGHNYLSTNDAYISNGKTSLSRQRIQF